MIIADLVIDNDASNALRIPEELVHVVVTDDILVIPLSSHEFRINHLVTLIPDEPIERLDNGLRVTSSTRFRHSGER